MRMKIILNLKAIGKVPTLHEVMHLLWFTQVYGLFLILEYETTFDGMQEWFDPRGNELLANRF